MNDFTKEELQIIYNVLDDTWGKSDDPLQPKIKHMIDSYCEHTETDTLYLTIYRCRKCKRNV